MIFDWDEPLAPERRDELIESIAQKVDRLGLNAPAIIFLEMHKPLTFLASQGILVGSGFLAPLFGPVRTREFSHLLESRDNVERLIQRIETFTPVPPGEATSKEA